MQQWFEDNWLVVLATFGAVVGLLSLYIRYALAKRETTEAVTIERVFLTHIGDELRVEIVNRGTIPVYIRSVGIYKPDDEKGFFLDWVKGDRGSPLDPGNHSIYARRVDEIRGYTKGGRGVQVAVRSNKQELDRTKSGKVDSLLINPQVQSER